MGTLYCALVALIAMGLSYPMTSASTSYETYLNQFEVKPLENESLGETFRVTESHSLDFCLLPSDCTDIQNCNHTRSGVYRVFPFGVGKGFLVFCDMETSGGGWLVFQRRQDGSVNFEQKWAGYKQGFGNLYGEFWLGLQKLHLLTSQRRYELMINIENYSGKILYALYSRFRISGEKQKFRLMLGTHSGTAADAMTYHNGYQFSTADSDNDAAKENNCGAQYRSGWWYKSCHYSNLNGEYVHAGDKSRLEYSGIAGYTWLKNYGHLQFVEMKIRPVGKS